MIRIPFQDIVAKLAEKSGLSQDEIVQKIEAKQVQLNNLVSREGAGHIIASELGVRLVENSGKIKDIYAGMRNIEVTGKILQRFDPRTFQRSDGTAGQLASFVIGDETGVLRVVAWGNAVEQVKQFAAENVVRISGAMAKESMRGGRELHCNEHTRLSVLEGVQIEIKGPERKRIVDLSETEDRVEVLGTVIQLFDPRFFEVCPQCGTRVKNFGESWVCDKHAAVQPEYSYLLSIFLDDGSGAPIRVVLFRQQAERLLGKTRDEIIKFHNQPETFEPEKNRLLGEQFKLVGRVKKNPMTEQLELVANQIWPVQDEDTATASNGDKNNGTPTPPAAVEPQAQPSE